MEAETQTEEEQVNIIEPSDPINYSNGHWIEKDLENH
jgi:hypothetical protein